MGSIVLTWRELLIAAIVVLGVYVAELVLLLRHGRSPKLQFWRRWRKPAPPPESFAVVPLRREISELRQQFEALRADSAHAQTTPYANAIQIARSGGEVQDISAQCDISRGEAELIAALYRKR
jgi:hypothetical protein